MKADTIFDLPELLDALGTHLPQGTLYHCIQVSKTWYAAFIPHLWRTFTEDTTQQSGWSSGLASAIQMQLTYPQSLDWYKDVYRRHAKYIRHLSITTPTMLDVCLEGAFEQLRSELYSEKVSTGSSGTTTTTEPATAAAATVTGAGGSLMGNLESLDLNIFIHDIGDYFPIRVAGGPFGHSSGFASTGFGTGLTTANASNSTGLFGANTGFGTGLFGASAGFGTGLFGASAGFGTGLFGANTGNSTGLFGANTNNITGDNNSNSTGNATTNSITATTATEAPPSPPDTEKAFVNACQRLVLNNPRLHTLSGSYSMEILQGLEGGGVAVLRSLKNLSCASTDGQIPALLPPNVTHLMLNSISGFRLSPYSPTSGNPGTTALVHEGLESLEVAYIQSAAHLRGLLAQAPSLKTLSTNGIVSNFGSGGFLATATPIPEEIPLPASQITVLKCQQTRSGAYNVASGLVDFLGCFPLLVEYHDDVWLPAAGPQLVKHCPLLEVICINRASAFGAFGSVSKPRSRPKGALVLDSVSILLTSLSRLRVLDIPHEAIKAETILKTPWVCLDLEKFRCQIAEVPFLTDEEEQQVQIIRQQEAGAIGSGQECIRTDEEDALITLSERCVHTREGIMAQLSKLTSLKFLSLSPDFKAGIDLFENRMNARLVYKSERDGRSYIRYDDVSPDTLYFRLDNGLGQLASLTKLEYLSFESMDHRMGTADIEWFASHLPRLKEMRGLVMENHVGMEPDPENDALVALIRRLRPDVAQKQSFGGYLPYLTNTNIDYLNRSTRTTSRSRRYR